MRTDITRFPHAVLEVKLSLPEGTDAPAWVRELAESDRCTEVHKFSKFIHGTCTLFPTLVQVLLRTSAQYRTAAATHSATPAHLVPLPLVLVGWTQGSMCSRCRTGWMTHPSGGR